MGGVSTLETQVGVLAARGPGRVSPFTIPMVMPNAGAAALSLRFGLQGPCETMTTACAAGTHSIAAGARLVADGRCDVVLAGGAESSMTPTTRRGVHRHDGAVAGRASAGRSTPRRDGFCMSEGAAVLVLEEREAALARGARVYGEVLGAAAPATPTTSPRPSPGGAGAAACMRLALDDAELDAGRRPRGQRPRHLDAAQRRRRGAPRSPPSSARAACPSRASRASPATASAPPARSRRPACCCRSCTASCRRRWARPRSTPRSSSTSCSTPRAWEPGPTISNCFGFGGHNGSLVLGPA